MARWDLGTKFPHGAIPPTSSTSLLPGKGEFQLTGCCADAGLHPAPCSQWVRGLCASSEQPPRWALSSTKGRSHGAGQTPHTQLPPFRAGSVFLYTCRSFFMDFISDFGAGE